MSDHAAEEQGGHAPLVPALADHGALAMTEAELRDWGHRFGRSTHPPLVVTLSGRAGRGEDDARAGDLRGLWGHAAR